MNGVSVIVTAPATEPVTLTELRTFMRIGEGNSEPAPTKPTVALIDPAAAGNVDNGVHRYRVTFVTADGETEGGEISDAVTVADKAVNGKVTVSAIPLGGSLVTSRKVYRTIAGGSTYLLLTTIADNTTTTYTDNTADSGLGAQVPSTNTTADAFLTSLLKAARQHLESLMGRAFITQTWDHYLDAFPCGDRFPLPHAPLASITSITLTDTAGAETTMSTDLYFADAIEEPGYVVLKYAQSWPSTTLRPAKGIKVRYVAGRSGASSWEGWEPVRTAIKQLCNHWYRNPDMATPEAQNSVPFHVHALIANWRVRY